MRLQEIPTGGRTPLAAKLRKGMEVLDREMRKKHGIIPMMMIISDGRANAGEGPIRNELLQLLGCDIVIGYTGRCHRVYGPLSSIPRQQQTASLSPLDTVR